MKLRKMAGIVTMLSLSVVLTGINSAQAASVRWINAAGGNWSTGANWSTGTPPTPNDTALIQTSGTYTVTVDGNFTVLNFTVGRSSGIGIQTLSIPTGNSLTITSATSNISNSGALDLAGTLTGASSLTTASGSTMTWSGGTLSGNGAFTCNGALVLTGAAKTLSRTSSVRGQTTWSSGDIVSGITLTNSSTGIFTTTTTGLTMGGAGFTFANSGVLDPVPNVTATLNVMGNFTNNSTGTYNVDVNSAAAFDQILVSGNATLAGTAFVRDTVPLAPSDTMVFILTFNTFSGQFNSPTTSTSAASYNVSAQQLFKAVRLLRNLTYISNIFQSNTNRNRGQAGDPLTISGHDLDGPVSVNFRNTTTGVVTMQTSFTLQNNPERPDGATLTTTVPAGLDPGSYQVNVTSNADETNPNTSNERPFEVVAS